MSIRSSKKKKKKKNKKKNPKISLVSNEPLREKADLWCGLYVCTFSFATQIARSRNAEKELPVRPLLPVDLVLVDALDVPRHVHLLLGPVGAVWTLELRLLAALPLAMVAQTALQLVDAAAVLTSEVLEVTGATGGRVLLGAAARGVGRAPDDRGHVPGVPG